MANYVNNPAFTANGNTVCINAGTATASAQIRTGTSGSPRHCRVYNNGSVPVFIQFGTSAVTASIPVQGTPTGSWPVGAGAIEIFAIGGGNSYVAAILPSSSASVFFTPGEGI